MSATIAKILALVAAVSAIVWGSVAHYRGFVARIDRQGFDRAATECIAREQAQGLAHAKKEREANDAFIESQKALQGVTVAAVDASNRLRATIAQNRALLVDTRTPAPALALSGLAFGAVFEECAGRYTTLAGNADRHVIDVRRLREICN